MKKSLYLTSALVAASVLALGSTASMAASKAKPMKVGVSGSYKAVVGFAKQQGAFENVGSGSTASSYNTIDVKTDSEVHFKASTKTDGGLSLGVGIELETDQASTATIDGSYMTIGGSFGTVMLGNAAAAAAILAVNAPSTGAIGIFGGDSAAWVVKPANVGQAGFQNVGANIGGGDHAKIRWTSKKFSGVSVGGSYIPSLTSSNDMAVNGGNTAPETSQLDAAAKYTGKVGAADVNASFGYWTTDAGTASIDAWSMGASAKFGQFTIGAGYKDITSEGKDKDGKAISGETTSKSEEVVNIGGAWNQGDTTLSINYFEAEQPQSTAVSGVDSVEKWTLGAKYAMGPGVDFLGTLQQVSWGDEVSTTVGDNNKGIALVGGIAVKF